VIPVERVGIDKITLLMTNNKALIGNESRNKPMKTMTARDDERKMSKAGGTWHSGPGRICGIINPI
jgi:hypothetical protein